MKLQSVQHGQKHVNIVLIDSSVTDSSVLPAHAVDLLVSGSQDEIP